MTSGLRIIIYRGFGVNICPEGNTHRINELWGAFPEYSMQVLFNNIGGIQKFKLTEKKLETCLPIQVIWRWGARRAV